MAKYRKIALVEAEQFLPPHQVPAGCYQAGGVADVSAGHGEWMLDTLEGPHPLRYADYVCVGVVGERWNVEQSIFEATYELASSSPAIVKEAGEVGPPNEDWLTDVLDDSLDMDWTGRVGARAIIARWGERHD